MADSLPFIVDLTEKVDSVAAFRRLADRPHCGFLDSARRSASLGRYSFVVADPFKVVDDSAPDPVESFAGLLASYRAETAPQLPPFQGGALGVWSYDLARVFERVPPCRLNEFPVPAMLVGFYDVVIAFDHELNTAHLISQGFPETEEMRRVERAWRRAEMFFGVA